MTLRSQTVLRASPMVLAIAMVLASAPAQAQDAPENDATASQVETAASSDDSGTMERASEDMRAVLEKLTELGAKPIHTLSVEEARTQPTPRMLQWQSLRVGERARLQKRLRALKTL